MFVLCTHGCRSISNAAAMNLCISCQQRFNPPGKIIIRSDNCRKLMLSLTAYCSDPFVSIYNEFDQIQGVGLFYSLSFLKSKRCRHLLASLLLSQYTLMVNKTGLILINYELQYSFGFIHDSLTMLTSLILTIRCISEKDRTLQKHTTPW